MCFEGLGFWPLWREPICRSPPSSSRPRNALYNEIINLSVAMFLLHFSFAYKRIKIAFFEIQSIRMILSLKWYHMSITSGAFKEFFFFSQVSYPLLTYDSLYIWYDFNCNEPDLISWHINANEFLRWFDDLNCLLWNMRLSDLIIKINHCTLGWEYWKKQAKVVFLIIIAKVFSFCAFISKNDWNEFFFFLP